MNATIHMTGPHRQSTTAGRYRLEWRVSLTTAGGTHEQSKPKTYRVFNYWRAVQLACNMAHDRRLFLKMEALPVEI
jgi:surface-anchored protein